MKKHFLLLYTLLLLSFWSVQAQENNLILISGQVIDRESSQPLPGVSVFVKGGVTGTATNVLCSCYR